jgi:thioredoxin 1
MFNSLFGSKPAGPRPGVVTAKEAQEKLAESPAPFLLDVREPSEYKSARIRGATLIPLNQLQKRAAEVPTDREIIVVCQSGSRSGMATDALRKVGLNALNLDGGLSAWMRAGLPVERG